MQSVGAEVPFDPEEEYRAIESALLETARGRWFLAEHSRRSRRIETDQLQDAIDRLKSSMRDPPALLGRLQTELDHLVALIKATRTELLSRQVAPQTADGTSASPMASLLKASEDLHEQIWGLQAREIDVAACEQIGRKAAAIFALTARQAQEGQRAQKLAEALDVMTARVRATLETLWLETSGDEAPSSDHPNTAA